MKQIHLTDAETTLAILAIRHSHDASAMLRHADHHPHAAEFNRQADAIPAIKENVLIVGDDFSFARDVFIDEVSSFSDVTDAGVMDTFLEKVRNI